MNVDYTEESPTVLSFCAGYGGIDLGVSAAIGRELNVLAYAEIEAYAISCLISKMESEDEALSVPIAPIWTDIKTFPSHLFRGKVDILFAGYPCQPFSGAGKKEGVNDPRHLWPYIRETISDVRPRRVFCENVEGHISIGLDTVLSDMAEMGYRVTAGIFSASEPTVGAPHQRKRIFWLAELGDSQHDGSSDTKVGRDTQKTGKHHQEGKKATLEFEGTSRPEGHGNIQGVELADSNSVHRWSVKESKQQTGDASRKSTSNSSGELADSESVGCRGGQDKDGANRERVPILKGEEQPMVWSQTEGCSGDTRRWPARPGEDQYEWEEPRVLAKSKSKGLEGRDDGRNDGQTLSRSGEGSGAEQDIGVTESGVGFPADGHPKRLADTPEGVARVMKCRTDAIRLAGNGVVPQVAKLAWETLSERLK